MSGQANCLRFDQDEVRGGYVLTSTQGSDHGKLFLTYTEVMHALLRVHGGFFANVLDNAQHRALEFGPKEITPETAEFTAREYQPVTAQVPLTA